MKMLLIDNYDSFTYNLAHLVREIGVNDLVVKRNDKIELEEVDAYSHILLSPGPGLPSEAGDLLEIVERYKEKKSILGVCLGHQAIVESFGGELENLEVVAHGKQHEISIDTASHLFAELPKTIKVGRYHSWIASKKSLPQNLKITASLDEDIIMGIEHATLPLFGIQFHPESIMTENGSKILKNWISA